jgi:hypothetical protein
MSSNSKPLITIVGGCPSPARCPFGVFYTNLIEYYSQRMDGDTLVPQLLSMFRSGLPGIALLLLRASWPIVVFSRALSRP